VEFTPQTSESLPGIFNFLVECSGAAADRVETYPRQYAPWKDGCVLYSPLDGKLSPGPKSGEGNTVGFKVAVPRAVAVAVVVGTVGSEWVMLKQRGQEEDAWEGDVDLMKVWNSVARVAVCAAFEGSADTYSTLLEYTT